MINKLTLIVSLFTFNLIFSQDYMSGQKKYCETSDPKILELYDLGFRSLQFKDMIGASTNVFFDITKKAPTLCDAYFWTGYTLRLQNKPKLALAFYYTADSLSNNKSIEFKQNLAMTSILVGKIDLARKKYSEMINYFPESPEGFYGFALTSTMIGDVEKGLENIKIAIEKYGERNNQIKNETELMYGILLTLNKKYEESLIHFEECSSKYRKDDNFNIHYSLSLLKVAELTNDEKMKKKGLKLYEKIEKKEEISETLKPEFKI
jgi:tetratricopeptide (TPR) repeat protein